MFFRKKFLFFVIPFFVTFLVGMSGCVGGPGDFPPVTGSYKLKASDPIYIQFSGTTDLTPLDIVIDEKGEVGLLYIEERVKAAGLTTSELEEKVENLYIDGNIYPAIAVNVAMTAKSFYVEGAVNSKQGQFPLAIGTTIRQAIAAAGGYSSFADKKRVTITRGGKTYTVNMRAIEKDPSFDFLIEVGDTIKVPEKRI